MKKVFGFLVAFLLLIGNYAYAITSANTVIANAASATYEDESGFEYEVLSNLVEVRVLPIRGVEVLPDYQERSAISGDFVNFPFYLKNSGNSVDRYGLSYENLSGDDGDFQSLELFVDLNGNGKVDPGEPLYDNDNPPSLEPGEVLSLILKAKVPLEVKKGQLRASLTGYSLSDPTKRDENNLAVAKLDSSGFVRLFKSSSKSQAVPGEELTFTVSFTNPGLEPVEGTNISVDFNNDGIPEPKKGILIADSLPSQLQFLDFLSAEPSATLVFKGEEDSFWKESVSEVKGEVREVGVILNSLQPDQEGHFSFKVRVKEGTPPGELENLATALFDGATSQSNGVFVRVLPVAKVIADDTDDGGGYSGSGLPNDPDDLTVVESASSGSWVEFRNEVWNLGNAVDTINLSLDEEHSINLPKGALVYFYSTDGLPLVDTNGDGIPDVGQVEPGKRVEFITKVFVPKGSYENVVFAIKGSSSLDPRASDLTYDEILSLDSVAIQVLTRVQALVQTQGTVESLLKLLPLEKKEVVAYEYSLDGELIRKKVFWTNSDGYIVYDEEGRTFPLYDWMRDNYLYRITVAEEINGYSYYLTPPFRKDYFRAVSQPGEERCWSFEGKEVDCSSGQAAVKVKVMEDGTKLLSTPLDPAGYVYDGITGEKINGACVYFYRCSDETCKSSTLVSPSKLDLYPDGATPQENPQLSGPTDGLGRSVGKGDGAFQFLIADFKPEDVGWYFIRVDFDCSLPAADASLKEKYSPVNLQADKVWDPYSGEPYRGEKFFVDYGFPGTLLMRVPLLPSNFKPLRVVKSVSTSFAFLGDFVRWTIKVENPNSDFTVYDVAVKDLLPRGLRYKAGTSKLDGKSFSDPAVKGGRELSWSVGDLPPGKSVEITFYTVLTPGVKEGKLKNLAYAQGWSSDEHWVPIGSNEAFAYLKVAKGVFTDRGYIIGRVFIDQNGNGLFDDGEVGVKGVKIYLEDGRFAVSGSEGKFHFDDVKPGTHVVKVDRTTLPPNASLEITSNRNAGDPGTVFADVYPGDLFKVNFPLLPAKVRVKAKGTFTPLEGKVSFKRVVEEVLTDPSNGKVAVKNSLILENRTPYPLYELTYEETSPYRPREGSSYLNGSPFKDPTFSGDSFRWRIPLVMPREKIVLSWYSPLPSKGGTAKGEVKFSLKPVEGQSVEVPVSLPVLFEVLKPQVYRLTVYFDFGSYSLTPEAKASLEKIADFLRRQNYREIVVKVVGHTDSVKVKRGNGRYRDNRELSLKRAEAVKAYLRELLIDLRKVRVES